MVQFVKRFWQEEEGVTAIEYGLIAALISLMIIAGATATGTSLKAIFDLISTKLGTAATAAGAGS